MNHCYTCKTAQPKMTKLIYLQLHNESAKANICYDKQLALVLDKLQADFKAWRKQPCRILMQQKGTYEVVIREPDAVLVMGTIVPMKTD